MLMSDSRSYVIGIYDHQLLCNLRMLILFREFTSEWFGWLFATGIFMACTWGSKVNGVLTVATVGVAVLIDLWGILDYKKSPSMVSAPFLIF